ncbi:MAG: RNA 3'-terminal phosphate cyclase [Deltaproteobacteria bacterium]|nr:RNA 3'-terminal phosphate cyclase [Deltaproteobacteria bacterium]
MHRIDGSQGEGGGQILRTALALSLVTGEPFRIDRIRAGRAKPGLLRQHLAAVHAAVQISSADVSGAELGSTWLELRPRRIEGGERRFVIGSAGSATLVLQAILPAILTADRPATIEIEGGTHNRSAPPYEFLAGAFAPLLRRMGAELEIELVRPGFEPAGGGLLIARTQPSRLRPLALLERGALVRKTATAFVSALPGEIAQRELAVIAARPGLSDAERRIRTVPGPLGPGNLLSIEIQHEQVTEIFTALGARGLPAEEVATRAADEAERYLGAGVPVGPYLADQLLLPLALAGGGTYRTLAPTPHTTTQAAVVADWLGTAIRWESEPGGAARVTVGS